MKHQKSEAKFEIKNNNFNTDKLDIKLNKGPNRTYIARKLSDTQQKDESSDTNDKYKFSIRNKYKKQKRQLLI